MVPEAVRTGKLTADLVSSDVDSRPLQPAQASLTGSGSVDLVGLPIADVVRIYIDRVDTTSDVVLCPDLVLDRRPVTIRASSTTSPAAFEAALRGAGYEVQRKGSVKYICTLPQAGYRDPRDSDSMPLQLATEYGSTIVLEPHSSPVDDVVASGARFIGCGGVGRNRTASFRKSGYGAISFPLRELRRSRAGAIYTCRG